MSRSILGKGLLALAITAASVSAYAGPYSSMYVFGDSLSDVGNDAVITGGGVPSTAYYTDGTNDGRFTNGLNYVDQLASRLGLNVTASTLGGTDYAYGGARTTYLAPGLAGLGALSFNQQITQFTSTHGVADSNGLFVLWIGANDMSDAIKARAAGDTAAIGNAISTAMTGIASAIVQLSSRGATNFLIPNLPDLAVTPGIQSVHSAGLSALAEGASVAFNSSLANLLSLNTFAALNITSLDVFSSLNDIASDPSAYGFTNASDACYTGDVNGAARVPGGPAPTVCADPSSYMFWDWEHPSAALHQTLGNIAFASVVPEPTSVSLIISGLLGIGFMRRKAMRT